MSPFYWPLFYFLYCLSLLPSSSIEGTLPLPFIILAKCGVGGYFLVHFIPLVFPLLGVFFLPLWIICRTRRVLNDKYGVIKVGYQIRSDL
jgi:hypothetical protein